MSDTDLLARLAELEAENGMLRGRVRDQAFIDALRSGFSVAAVTGTIGAPVDQSQLLLMIVQAAKRVLDTRAASLLLLDEGTDELVFEVAVREGAVAVKQFRVPVGYGIVGLVAQSGTPILTNDAQSDARHAADIAIASGLVAKSLVCVPLFVNGNLIGVMEVVDKQSGAEFDQDDVEVLEVLARQAAVAIEQARVQQKLAALVGEIVTWLGSNLDESDRQTLRATSGPFTSGLEGDLSFRRAIGMARLVREIASRGPDAAADCLRWLREYTRETRDRVTSDTVVAQNA